MRRCWHTLVLALGLSVGSGAGAHSDEHLDTLSAPHGGRLRMSGAYHFELVLEPGMVRLYVSDHAFRPVSVRGARGSAAVAVGGTRTVIPLRPAGEDLLAGNARLESAADARVTVSITFPGQKTESAEFAPRPVAATKSGSDEHEALRR